MEEKPIEYIVKVYSNGKVEEKKVEKGTNLLKFLTRNSYEISAPCGGQGTCGKCKVTVNGLETKASKKESKLLGEKQLSAGVRLACYTTVESDLEVYLGHGNVQASIVTEGKRRPAKFRPMVHKKLVTLAAPDLKDQSSDYERILKSVKDAPVSCNLHLLQSLPAAVREQNYTVTLVYFGEELIGVEPGDTTGILYGLAVDVGTTTLAAYLVDLLTGEVMEVYSCLNPQKKHGADVISRIHYAGESEQKQEEMHELLQSAINEIIDHFTAVKGIDRKDIYHTLWVGNTTMMHFLMNLPARHIAAAPFIPVTTLLHHWKAGELGIKINPKGYATLVPSVSAYIGADTIAAVIAGGIDEEEGICLLVDIGTNGEIVLGNKKGLYSCSVAAGPAFEGAHIRNGVGGIRGAIDTISLEKGLAYTTIGDEKAVGICGSGIVDGIAAMLDRGIIDSTGRILDADEMDAGTASEYGKRVIELEGITSFLIEESDSCSAGMDILITQKDIRELQNAKAAIAAGIKLLIKEAGIQWRDITKVYLAGGFGSYLKIESAVKIGLLPRELRGRIESIGNAAGSGAVTLLTSSKMLKKANKVKESVKNIELSANKEFIDEYIACMGFDPLL